ncbi:hypothetical protein HAX54_021111 [Datura stramonium]|uniref:Uncharacterized protein n=1 Tax=Datura stramonium TaxID=4076 RepID=A0ABS8S3V5_DATST|nr:hypothetical protein [Datura stramonium]
MASLLGTSSSAAAILASTPFSSRSSKSAVFSFFPSSGQSQEEVLWRIRVPIKKGRSQFHVAISNVATEISPAQEQAQKLAEDSQRPVYPFPAIVGQDEMKLCLC